MTDQSLPRMSPIMPPDWGKEAMAAMDTLPVARDNIREGWKSGKYPLGMNAVCTMLNHPAMAAAFLSFNAHFFLASKLPPRIREILIMRIAWLRHTEGEFLAHVDIGLRVGLNESDIERIKQGPEAVGLTPLDANLLRAADELKIDACISDLTWVQLAKEFDKSQMLEIVFIVGCYEVLAMVFNSCNVQMERGAKTLDDRERARLMAS